jgi:hypothetical protein
MDINRMRLGLVYIFKESKSIGSQSKLQLVNFIESADEHQLKMLALDGQIAGKNMLDESAKAILDERFVAATHIEESLKKASISAMNEIKESMEAGASTGATIGAILGLLSPMPGGILVGGAAGAGIGAVIGKWKQDNKQKVMAYCSKKFQVGSKEYKHCLSLGSQAMKQKVEKVKMQVAKKAKAKK